MKNVLKTLAVGSLFVVMVTIGPSLQAQQTIWIDEYGTTNNPYPSAAWMGNDTGPSGQTNVLTYQLPFAGVQGDVLINDIPDDPEQLGTNDLIRFTGVGTVIFYSLAGVETNYPPGWVIGMPYADVAVMPDLYYANNVLIQEQGYENPLGEYCYAWYTPNPGQPGYDVSNPTYFFISDVPEPATLSLLALGGLVLLWRRRS
jgi:hypothetical protein